MMQLCGRWSYGSYERCGAARSSSGANALDVQRPRVDDDHAQDVAISLAVKLDHQMQNR
jgi:hypothetical protein